MVKVRLFNYDYYNIFENDYDKSLECPILILCCRDINKKFYIFKVPGNKGIFRPHFYVEDTFENREKAKEMEREDLILEWSEWPYPAVYDEDERVLIVYTQYPYQVERYRKRFLHTYEADVRYPYMFLMRLGLDQGYFEVPDGKEWLEPEDIKPLPESEHFYVEARVFVVDIETDIIDENKPQFDLDNNKIISIVVYDNYENKYHRLEWDEKYEETWIDDEFIKRRFEHPDIPLYSYQLTYHCRSEKELLQKFFELFKRQPDGISTFNGHGGNVLKSEKSKTFRVWKNGFDEPIIYIRAKKLKLEKEMQLMSPLPRMENVYGRYYGVYKRGQGDKSEIVIRGVTPLDFFFAERLMNYTEKYRDFAKYGRSLDDYLKFFSNFHKIEHPGLTVAELRKIDLEKELLYNKIDVEGLFFLDKRFGFSKDIFDTVALSLVQGIDVLSATKIHDFLTLKEAQNFYVYDTKHQNWYRDVWQGWFDDKQGGYVVPAKKGRGEWTVVLDFSGLYPTLAWSANAGIDTLIQVAEEYDDYYIDRKGKKWYKKDVIITPAAPYRKDKESIEKRIWGKLLDIRQTYKNMKAEMLEKYKDPNHDLVKLYESKQYNLKQRLVNNKYGASGNKGYRAKHKGVYNTPPSMAQKCIKVLVREFLPSINYKDRGGDTDSIFVALKSDNVEDAIKESDILVKKATVFIDEFIKKEFNIDINNVKLDWEKIAAKFYAHKKKMYCMEVWVEKSEKGHVILSKNKRYIMYKGFELKKGNRADVTEMVQKTYLKIRLNTKDQTEFLKEITNFIRRLEEAFKYLDWTKICSRINIRKKLEEYQSNYMNKRAAEFANKNIGTNYGDGSHGFLGFLDLKGTHRLDPVIMFNKRDIKKLKGFGYDLDYKKHKQSFVIDKLNLLLEAYHTDYQSLLKRSRIKDVCVL